MNAIVETINSTGRAFVDFALPMLIQSGVLILILLAVDLILRRRVRAVFRYWIWMLVLAKLVLPPSLGSPVSVGRWFGDKLEVSAARLLESQEPAPVEQVTAESSSVPARILSRPDPAFMELSPLPATTPRTLPQPVEARAESIPVGDTAPIEPLPGATLNWQGLVLLAWSAIAAALLLLLVQRAFFVRGLVAQADEANGHMRRELESCRQQLGLRRIVGLRLSPNAASPAVCGLLRPVILIPQNLAPRLRGPDLQAVLLHELAHVRRGDLWVNLAQTLLQVVYFYNPLLWLANAVIRRVREQAVDETVLVAMGEAAAQYPETLIHIAKLAFQRRPALSLRLVGVVESKSALTARIRHILGRPIPGTAKLGLLGILSVSLAAFVLLPMAKGDPFDRWWNEDRLITFETDDNLAGTRRQQGNVEILSKDYEVAFRKGERLLVLAELYQTGRPMQILGHEVFSEATRPETLSVSLRRQPGNAEKTSIQHDLSVTLGREVFRVGPFSVEIPRIYADSAWGFFRGREIKSTGDRPYVELENLLLFAASPGGAEDRQSVPRIWIPGYNHTTWTFRDVYFVMVKMLPLSQLDHLEVEPPFMAYREQLPDGTYLPPNASQEQRDAVAQEYVLNIRRALMRDQMPLPELVAHRYYKAGEPIHIRMNGKASKKWKSREGQTSHSSFFMLIDDEEYESTFGTPLFSGVSLTLEVPDHLGTAKDDWSLSAGRHTVVYGWKDVDAVDPNDPDKPIHFARLVTDPVEFEVVETLPSDYYRQVYEEGWEDILRRSLATPFTDEMRQYGVFGPLLALRVDTLPFDTAFAIYVQAEGSEEQHPAGLLALTAGSLPYVTACDHDVDELINWDTAGDKRWRIILKPSVNVAKKVPPIHEFYGREFTTDWLSFERSPRFEENRRLAEGPRGEERFDVRPWENARTTPPRRVKDTPLREKPISGTRLNALVAQLKSDDEAAWKQAAEELKSVGPQAAEALVPLLREPPFDVRALTVLRSMAENKQVQDVMVRGLSDASPNVRHCSTLVLGESGNRTHIERIVPLLWDEGAGVPIAATTALANLGGDSAFQALLDALTLRWLIAETLAGMGRPEAIPYLKEALRQTDPAVPAQASRIAQAIRTLEGATGGTTEPSGITIGDPRFTTVLPNGVAVELLGVCEYPSEGEQWWRPDGQMLSEAPCSRHRGDKMSPMPEERAYEFCVRLHHLPDGGQTTIKIPSSHSVMGGGSPALKDGRYRDDLRWSAAILPRDQRNCTVRCGVAAGAWQTAAQTRGEAFSAAGTAGGGVTFSPASDDPKAGATITTSDDILDQPCRVVAVTTDGRVAAPSRTRGGTAGRVRQTTSYFEGLTLAQIAEFQFQTRPWVWVEFKNVSLRPGRRTDVRIDVGSQDAASGVPGGMVGTWLYENSAGDDEQMAIFADGRVVALYSNGHEDETNYDNGFITLGEYDNIRARMVLDANGTILQYLGGPDTNVFGKRWRRIAPEPQIELLAPLTGPAPQRGDAAIEPTVGTVGGEDKVVLPDADFQAVMLDLATGQLVSIPHIEPEARLLEAIREMGKGDLALDSRSLILVRGATSEQAAEGPMELVRTIKIGSRLPEIVTVTTAEGRRYEITILSVDDKACTLVYSPVSIDRDVGGGAPVEPGDDMLPPTLPPPPDVHDSGIEMQPPPPVKPVQLPNGVTVELLAYSRLAEAGLEWWTPQGLRTTIPGLHEADVEGHGTLLALRIEPEPEAGVSAWFYHLPDVRYALKPVWRMNGSNIWLVALGRERSYVNVEIQAQVRDPAVVEAVPVERKGAEGEVWIGEYGVESIKELQSVNSDSMRFTACWMLPSQQIVGVLDTSGRVHSVRPLPLAALPPEIMDSERQQRYEADVPLDRFAGIVIEGYSERAGSVKFRNISLVPGQPTQIHVEVIPEQGGPWWHPSQSTSELENLGRVLSYRAEKSGGQYPADLSAMREFFDDTRWKWLQEHVVYIGAGRPLTKAGGVLLAYEKVLLRFGFGTYVLYSDRRVEFETPARLKELGIPAAPSKPRPDEANAAVGTLEFRIAPTRDELSAATVAKYTKSFAEGNPIPGGDFAWFEVRPGMNPAPLAFAERRDGRLWLLLWNEPSHAMLAGQDWGLKQVSETTDAMGRRAVQFALDGKGTQLFGELTQTNVKNSVAILLDGKVLSAPTIASPITTGWGIITGNFTAEEIQQIISALREGMARSRLAQPVLGVLSGRVLDPEGNPAVGAQVALITEKIGVAIADGKLAQPRTSDMGKGQIVETDAQGLFRFDREPNDGFSLVAAHDAGSATVSSGEFMAGREIRLEKWGRIEGQVAKGRQALEDKIWMGGVPNVTWLRHRRDYQYETRCDSEGQFVFERVPAGRFEVGYLIKTGDASSSLTSRTPVVVKPGETTTVKLGGEGRPVIGRFVPQAGYSGAAYFGWGLRSLHTRRPDPPKPPGYDQMTRREQQEWTTQWWRSAEGRAYADTIWQNPDWRAYVFRINRDGSFRIEDVIPGEYDLTVWLEEQPGGQGRPEEIGAYNGVVKVPPTVQTYTDEPLDLGDLIVSMRNPVHVGDMAPLFEARTLDGKDIRLIDYRGKFVLLSFWQPTSHLEVSRLKELHETCGGSGRLQIIGLGGGDTLQEVEKYVAEHKIEWPQAYFGEKWDEGIAAQYGLSGTPYILLADPEGKIVATWLRGEKLTDTVREMLKVLPAPAPLANGSASTGLAWQRTDRYIPPDANGFFPDDPEGGRKLDALFQAVDKDRRANEEILSTVRNGFRRTTEHRTLILGWIGNRYIWGKDPQNPQAIEIMYHAIPLERHYAVYFGLSVVRDKTPNILRTLADICMEGEEVGRITWGLGPQREALLPHLSPHLQDKDVATRQRAELLVKHFKGELDFEQWQREKRREQAEVQLGDQLPRLRRALLTGDSGARYQALTTLMRNFEIVLDDAFLPAMQEAAADPSPQVRNEVARSVGGRWVWHAQQQDPNAIELMLKLSSDTEREVRYNAVYYGLSTVRDKSEAVVRRLVEMALADHESNLYGRIVWGLKGPTRDAPELFTKVLALHLDRTQSDPHFAASVYQLHRDVLGTEPSADWRLSSVRDRYPDDVFAVPFSAREPFRPAEANALWSEFSTALLQGITAERLPNWHNSRTAPCHAKIRGKERAEAVRNAIENHPRLRVGEIQALTVPMQLFLEERYGPAAARTQSASPEPPTGSRTSTQTPPGPIQQKIDAAAPGGTVRLEPGIYRERLRIDKPLTLEGAGWDRTTVVMESRMPESRQQAADLLGQSVLAVAGARGVTIRGIKFTAPGRRIGNQSLPTAIVSLSHCEARLSDCAVISGAGDGIHVVDQSSVVLQRCLVAAVWGTGIRVGSGKDVSTAGIEDSDIRNCHYAGIHIARNNKATVERCRVSGAAWHGIRYDDASPSILGSLIFGNARCGIYASGRTAGTVKGNLFHADEMTGMSCWFQNKDLIEGNTFANSKGPGLAILGASKPSVRGNIFYANPVGVSIGDIREDSPFAKSDGSAALQDNVFWANEHEIQRVSDAGVAQTVVLDQKAGTAIDPRFTAPEARDFSLKADSPARQKGIGAVNLIPFESPWPLQPEELAIIPPGNTRDYRQWRDPPLP